MRNLGTWRIDLRESPDEGDHVEFLSSQGGKPQEGQALTRLTSWGRHSSYDPVGTLCSVFCELILGTFRNWSQGVRLRPDEGDGGSQPCDIFVISGWEASRGPGLGLTSRGRHSSYHPLLPCWHSLLLVNWSIKKGEWHPRLSLCLLQTKAKSKPGDWILSLGFFGRKCTNEQKNVVKLSFGIIIILFCVGGGECTNWQKERCSRTELGPAEPWSTGRPRQC